jgi:hypothetical protein
MFEPFRYYAESNVELRSTGQPGWLSPRDSCWLRGIVGTVRAKVDEQALSLAEFPRKN